MNIQDGELGHYIAAVNEYPLLNHEEIVELATIYNNEDKTWSKEAVENARRKLINHNLRLVVSVAKRYIGLTSMTLSDLIQEGNIGLMRAVDLFNPSLGYQFSTYAKYRIKERINAAIIYTDKMIRVPQYVHDLQRKVRKIARKNNKEESEIAEQLPAKKQDKLSSAESVFCFNESVEKEKSLGNVYDPAVRSDPLETMICNEERELLESALELMEISNDEAIKREAHVLKRRYYYSEKKVPTFVAIGDELGLSRSRPAQLHDSAIIRLKKLVGEEDNV